MTADPEISVERKIHIPTAAQQRSAVIMEPMLVGQKIEMLPRAAVAPRPSTAQKRGARAEAPFATGSSRVIDTAAGPAADANSANTRLFGDFLRKSILGAVSSSASAGSREVAGKAFRHLHRGQVDLITY